MREIVLDSETTGLDPQQGDRIVEIACVELVNKLPTGKVFQCYFDPQRKMSGMASKITGLTDDFLCGKPLFADKVQELLGFISDSVLVIHNADFDLKFLNFELGLLKLLPLEWDRVIDTLQIARKKFSGLSNNLDALCRRFGIDNSERDYHGALLDAQLLADVYLELTGGRQTGFKLMREENPKDKECYDIEKGNISYISNRSSPLKPKLTWEEHECHIKFLNDLPVLPQWLKSEKETE